MMQAKRYLTVRDIAQLLSVDRYRVYEWVRDSQIPYLRTVGRILFDPNEIEQWLRRDRGNTNPDSRISNISVNIEGQN